MNFFKGQSSTLNPFNRSSEPRERDYSTQQPIHIPKNQPIQEVPPSQKHFSSPSKSPQPGGQMAFNHVDVEEILEDFAWNQFKDVQSLRKTRMEEFKGIERDDVEFVVNRKNLVIIHEDPDYHNFLPQGAKPFTLFKSVFTNNTNRPQEYSFKTERTTESLCAVAREQGYSIGAEAELTLKTPCEIAELKAGFKHEMHFNNLNENAITESLTWGVDSNVSVPPGYQTEASIVIEEMNYRGSYTVVSRLSGVVVVSLRRRRDNSLIMPIRANIAEIFRQLLDSNICKKEIKAVAKIEGNKIVQLTSKGNCQFQFATKQRIDLNEMQVRA